jgi:hypothetical protein
MHRAAALGHLEALELYLELGASPAALDTSKRTPLHWAAIRDNTLVVACLLRRLRDGEGGGLNYVDDEGRSALHYAAVFGFTNVVKCLVEAGAKLDLKDNDSKTPRDWAQEKGNCEAMVLAMLEPPSKPLFEEKKGEVATTEQLQRPSGEGEALFTAARSLYPNINLQSHDTPEQNVSEPRRGKSALLSGSEPHTLFICPITQDIMVDPVVADDGYTYERAAIETWFMERLTSPLTNMAVKGMLIPNHLLKSEILQWKGRNSTAGRSNF